MACAEGAPPQPRSGTGAESRGRQVRASPPAGSWRAGFLRGGKRGTRLKKSVDSCPGRAQTSLPALRGLVPPLGEAGFDRLIIWRDDKERPEDLAHLDAVGLRVRVQPGWRSEQLTGPIRRINDLEPAAFRLWVNPETGFIYQVEGCVHLRAHLPGGEPRAVQEVILRAASSARPTPSALPLPAKVAARLLSAPDDFPLIKPGEPAPAIPSTSDPEALALLRRAAERAGMLEPVVLRGASVTYRETAQVDLETRVPGDARIRQVETFFYTGRGDHRALRIRHQETHQPFGAEIHTLSGWYILPTTNLERIREDGSREQAESSRWQYAGPSSADVVRTLRGFPVLSDLGDLEGLVVWFDPSPLPESLAGKQVVGIRAHIPLSQVKRLLGFDYWEQTGPDGDPGVHALAYAGDLRVWVDPETAFVYRSESRLHLTVTLRLGDRMLDFGSPGQSHTSALGARGRSTGAYFGEDWRPGGIAGQRQGFHAIAPAVLRPAVAKNSRGFRPCHSRHSIRRSTYPWSTRTCPCSWLRSSSDR